MPTRVPAVERVERAVAAALSHNGRYVIAVSGGRDSMALLDAIARQRLSTQRLTVATFDHGTGQAASHGVELAAHTAGLLGLPAVVGHAGRSPRSEAAWRAARWKFLRQVADAERARVVTAHTRDDQVETVVIRVLRDSGARGLAALFASSDVVRPLLDVTRRQIHDYADALCVDHVEDPSNVSRSHLRNRVRLDLLPALCGARPGFDAELLDLSRRAADWRLAVERLVDALGLVFLDRDTIRIAASSLYAYDAASLRIIWPEVAARAGVTMDRRGTERAAAFTIDRIAALSGAGESHRRSADAASAGGRGRVIQLSGGAEIEQVGSAFVLRRL